MNIAHQCKGHGVKKIILSSVVATGRVNADVLIYFDEPLKNPCTANWICFVNNNDISEGNLNKDSLHLLKAGKSILAKNFINGINQNNFLLTRRETNHFSQKTRTKILIPQAAPIIKLKKNTG